MANSQRETQPASSTPRGCPIQGKVGYLCAPAYGLNHVCRGFGVSTDTGIPETSGEGFWEPVSIASMGEWPPAH